MAGRHPAELVETIILLRVCAIVQDLAELQIRANTGIVEHGPAPSVGLVAVITHDRVVMNAFDTLRVVQDDALDRT